MWLGQKRCRNSPFFPIVIRVERFPIGACWLVENISRCPVSESEVSGILNGLGICAPTIDGTATIGIPWNHNAIQRWTERQPSLLRFEAFYPHDPVSSTSLLDLTKGFSFGIDLDDPWRYSGMNPPRSIIIPHLLSISLPEGKILDEADDREIRARGEVESGSVAGRAVVSLSDYLVQSKVDFVRCWFPWKYFEPLPIAEANLDHLLEESYSHWPLDDLVSTLTSHGIGIVPVIGCGYHRMLPQGLEPDKNKTLYLKRVSTHARLLVRKYKDQVKCWQIENEPNWWTAHEAGGWRSGSSWIRDPIFKQQLLRRLNTAVHTEDSSAKTIINLEADAKTLDPGAYSSSCGIFRLDFYPNYRSSHPINTKVLKLADDVAKALGKPVMISETGYPSGPSFLGYSAERQAEYVDSACRDEH